MLQVDGMGPRGHLVRDRDADANKLNYGGSSKEGRHVLHQQREIYAIKVTGCQSSVVERWAAAVRDWVPDHSINLCHHYTGAQQIREDRKPGSQTKVKAE